MFDYDAEMFRYQERFWSVLDIGAADHVLDIGCGAGLTTREAARAAASGSALGVDTSAPRLEVARRRADEEGLRNITFLRADAQTHRFPPGRFDLAISRFGTMFFADPVAAFTNIGRALRPGVRLVQLVWQGSDRQEWNAVISEIFGDADQRAGLDPFTLGDPAVVEGILSAAGFTGVDLADVREPVYYGPDVPAAVDAVRTLQMTQDRLALLDASRAEQACEQLRAALAARLTDRGVLFDSRAWIVTARRGGRRAAGSARFPDELTEIRTDSG